MMVINNYQLAYALTMLFVVILECIPCTYKWKEKEDCKVAWRGRGATQEVLYK